MPQHAVFALCVLSLAAVPAFAQHVEKKSIAKRPIVASKLRYQCKVGPYEKQTRLVMETVRDKPVYLAYWSSNGPFHCSFESWPGDGRATWIESGAGTVINLISGNLLIERERGRFILHAREVDRMPYCGTDGIISGVLTVPVPRGDCTWEETSSEEASQLK
jgi:hypothetical protein